MSSETLQEWFEYWFDSPYYHELYRNRNDDEARAFIVKVLEVLQLEQGEQVLDLACGRGRHTGVLAAHGLRVTGIDLSAANIAVAQSLYPDQEFHRADMRNSFPGTYGVIFNVFTSFGYFENPDDNQRVISNMCKALQPGGWLVLDYLNPTFITANLQNSEHVHRPERSYEITRSIRGNWVIKHISFEVDGIRHEVEEKVRLISQAQFVQLLAPYAMKMVHTFGSYALDPFDDERSERMIMLIQK